MDQGAPFPSHQEVPSSAPWTANGRGFVGADEDDSDVSRWWWARLDDAWTSGPLLMKGSLIDGLVLPFSKMKAKYQSGEDACASPWIGETAQGGPAMTERMTGGDFPTLKSTGKEGSVTRGTETPSLMVYVNNYHWIKWIYDSRRKGWISRST